MQLLAERDRADVVAAAGVALHPHARSMVPLAELQVLGPVVSKSITGRSPVEQGG